LNQDHLLSVAQDVVVCVYTIVKLSHTQKLLICRCFTYKSEQCEKRKTDGDTANTIFRLVFEEEATRYITFMRIIMIV
jgi:hypothetical protein